MTHIIRWLGLKPNKGTEAKNPRLESTVLALHVLTKISLSEGEIVRITDFTGPIESDSSDPEESSDSATSAQTADSADSE